MPKPRRWNDDELAAFEEGLTPANLTAVMRSTWTWDDRALRRDLARLLTDLRAVGELESDGVVHELVRRRTLRAASHFLAAVLGPRVVADSGHANSYSFSDVLIRSPWLSGGPEEERWLRAVATDIPASASTASGSALEFGSALAVHALSASGDRGLGAEHLAKVEAGALSATLAAAEASGSWDPALVRTRAMPDGTAWLLDGEKLFVPHGDTAELILVIARSTAGPSLFAVESGAAGLTVSTMATIDPSRPLARLQLRDVPATLVGVEGAGGRLMMRALDLATVSLAEEQVQGTRRCLELGAAAMRDADWPLGDAVRLRSEHQVQVEVAHAMYEHARRLSRDDTAESSVAAAMVHLCCSETFASVAEGTLRLTGGADDDVTALFLRAQSSALLFGGPALYYERLLERMAI